MFRIFAIVLLAAAAAQATTFSNCDDLVVNGPPILAIDVEGCEVEPCNFLQGHNISARITFQAPFDTNTLLATVRADALGVIVDYPLNEPNACNVLDGAECPLVEDEVAVYVLTMPILPIYPLISLRVEHTLTGDDGKKVSCFWLQGQVVRP